MKGIFTRRGVVGLAIAAMLLLITAYQPALAQREPIKIGAIVPLTGPSGTSGQAMQKGYQLALQEINRTGVLNRKVDLVVEDDRGDPPTGAAAFLKLVTRDRVDVLIGGLQSNVSIAVAAQARPVFAGVGQQSRISSALDCGLSGTARAWFRT